ncbi:hypothetical protein [Anabaena azotica]|uniref:hypothetical protein n=1 Tax=Anabaena azotica TaxID=197653 RepID=UPI0039A6A3EA
MFHISQYSSEQEDYLLMQVWETDQKQKHLCDSYCDINYYQLKIDNWKANLAEIQNQLNSISDVNKWNLLFKFLKKPNLDPLYENLNRINQEVKIAIENYVYVMEESKEDNLLHLTPLLEIIVDVNMMMNKLSKKDVQLFLLNQS